MTVINVNGSPVETDKVTDAQYTRALEAGLYALVMTGEIDIKSISADPENKDNIIQLSSHRLAKVKS